MIRILGILLIFLCASTLPAQELFVISEPASTVPKGVLGLKVMSETYNESGAIRNQFAARIMYGLTSRLSLWAQPMVSNHHGLTLPSDLVSHTHSGPNTILSANQVNYGKKYPYSFSGLHLYAKYRIINFDQDDEHFRIAVYGESTAFGSQAHDEAEAHLQGDNAGYGGGAIFTYLKSRLAVSFTGGFIAPSFFEDKKSNNHYAIDYSDAFSYSLSFGYLLYPRKYESYNQSNFNIYAEFIGKSYGEAGLSWLEQSIEVQTDALRSGSYLDAYFGIQRIVNSNDRIELSLGFPLINKSYRHFYPILNLAWQRYFYFD